MVMYHGYRGYFWMVQNGTKAHYQDFDSYPYMARQFSNLHDFPSERNLAPGDFPANLAH